MTTTPIRRIPRVRSPLQKPPGNESLKREGDGRSRMFVPLQETVQPGIIDAAGYLVTIGGIVATALWLKFLGR
ncbi:Uncharacterized protein LC1Hm_1486 [Halomicrobium sp. LC1Hm]|nr:Uncharacterized protein LC1Hm_1486 [Halomicrobium sp. LC1Hm]